jgi:hypothetical protein
MPSDTFSKYNGTDHEIGWHPNIKVKNIDLNIKISKTPPDGRV